MCGTGCLYYWASVFGVGDLAVTNNAPITDGNAPERDDSDDDDILTEAREAYAEDLAAWSVVREEGLEDLRFGKGEQWPSQVATQRELEGRPCLTINLQPAFIRQVVNEGRQNRPQIKVRPVDSYADPQKAKIFEGLIRHIESSSDADVAYDTGLDAAARTGMGFFMIDVDYAYDDTFDKDIMFRRIANPFSVVFDAASTAADSSDWCRCHVTELIDRPLFEKLYPNANAAGFDGDDMVNPWLTTDQVRLSQYYQKVEVDRKVVRLSNGMVVGADEMADPEVNAMLQANGIQVLGERVAKSCKIVKRLITGREVLAETEWYGSIIPVIPVFGEEINVEGRRYFHSLIHDGKDAQRELNYWNTTATELLALTPKAPWIGPKGAFKTDAQKWGTANTKTWDFIEYDGATPPSRMPFDGVPAGVLQQAVIAADNMKRIIGIHDASTGMYGDEVSGEASGKAIRYRKHQADTSVYHFTDNLNRAIRCAGRVCIDLIPQVYSGPRIVRILGLDGKPQPVALGPEGSQPPEGFDAVYDLSVGKYDLVVEAGPSYATRREEAVESITAFIQAYPAAAPILGDMVAKMSDWPEHEEVGQRLETLLPPAIQAQIKGEPAPPPEPPPEVQAMQAKAAADIEIQRQDAVFKRDQAREDAIHRNDLERMQAEADMAVNAQRATQERELMQKKADLQFELMEKEMLLKAALAARQAAQQSTPEIQQ